MKTKCLCIFLASLLFTFTHTAVAKEGFYISAGVGMGTASGQLDGNTLYSNHPSTPTEILLAGKLSPGIGASFKIGYELNNFFALEYISSSINHTATHSFIVAGDNSSKSRLDSSLFNIKVKTQLSENSEIFFRLGTGSYQVEYEKFDLIGYVSAPNFIITNQKSVTFSGQSIAIGAGGEIFIGPVGLELSYDVYKANLNKVKTSSFSGVLSSGLDAAISTLKLAISYHF